MIGALLISNALWAQPEDEIVYYTDSKVNNSRFNLALNVDPYFTDMRLINSDAENSLVNTFDDQLQASGDFRLNYGLDLFYEIGPSFHIGIGFGRSYGAYTWDQVLLDTNGLYASNAVEVAMYTVPIKVNFTTQISEVFSLEVVPTVEMNFLNRYSARFEYGGVANAPADSSFNLNDRLQDLNWSVGIALGGTYWFSDSFGFFVRGSIKYMLNDIIGTRNNLAWPQATLIEQWPRETLINFGGNLGLRVKF